MADQPDYYRVQVTIRDKREPSLSPRYDTLDQAKADLALLRPSQIATDVVELDWLSVRNIDIIAAEIVPGFDPFIG